MAENACAFDFQALPRWLEAPEMNTFAAMGGLTACVFCSSGPMRALRCAIS